MNRLLSRRFTWLVLVVFVLSMEGLPALAQDIIDAPDTQAGYATTGTGTGTAADAGAGNGTGASSASAPTGTEVVNEPLTLPADSGSWLLVDNYERYNIPTLELNEGESWNRGPCGQFAQTVAMKGRGKNVRFVDVLKEMNPFNIFTAPPDMVRYPLSKGFSAAGHNNSNLGFVADEIKNTKRSVICLIHCSSLEKKDGQYTIKSNGEPHWVDIIGVKLDTAGKPIEVLLKDSAYAWASQKTRVMPADEFDFRWKKMVGVTGFVLSGTSRFAVTMGEAGSVDVFDYLRNYFQYQNAGDVLANAVTTGARALDAMYRGLGELFRTGNPIEFIRGLQNLGGAVIKLVGGLVGTIVVTIGNGINSAGQWLQERGEHLWKEGGVLGKVAAVPLMMLGGALKLVGGVLTVIGNVVASVCQTISNIVEDIANAIAAFFGKIADAVGGFFKSIF